MSVSVRPSPMLALAAAAALQSGIALADTKTAEAWADVGPAFWIEQELALIRRDTPWPTVQARNLFHTSVAMHDAWAAFDPAVDGLAASDQWTGSTTDERLVRIAVGHAALEVMRARHSRTNRDGLALLKLDSRVRDIGRLDTADPDVEAAADLGQQIGRQVLAYYHDDGANEAAEYNDTISYRPLNVGLDPRARGTTLADPDRWQPIVVDGRTQEHVTPHWGQVSTFALDRAQHGIPYLDPGPLPILDEHGHAELSATLVEIIALSSRLEPGQDEQADYGRVVAEYWEDGPSSETPPGHWNLIALNALRELEAADGPSASMLFEIGLFLTLNAALHDAAVAAWDIKVTYDSVRPISLIRHMASLGQSSDPARDGYHPLGLPLVPGLIEIIDEQSAAADGHHANLAPSLGGIAIYCWRGWPEEPNTASGVGWMLAADWVPYQDDEFVTPAFGGYVSGHSTYSAAAATTLAWYFASDDLPGDGLRFVAEAGTFLEFEAGPTENVILEWRCFSDLARESGRSRVWGGIHPSFDDMKGREVGVAVSRLVRDRVLTDLPHLTPESRPPHGIPPEQAADDATRRILQ